MNFNAKTKMTLNIEIMKRLAIFSAALLMATLGFAQTIKVSKRQNRIKEADAIGYTSEVLGKTGDIENSLGKFLKEIGKVRSSSTYISVIGPTIGGIIYDGNVLYAKATGDDNKCEVWIGIDTADWKGRDHSEVMERIEKITYQFVVKYYRDLAQKDIDESQQALDATEKQKLKLVSQNKDLNTKLINNEQEKIRLEKALEINKLDNAVLKQKLINNKNSQDSVATAGVQIKKVLDAQKEKQRKIN
jgi:hypothetical protein